MVQSSDRRIKPLNCSGIPGVTKDAVNYVQDRLLLDLSEDEAAARLE